jgi:hypothetical protein
MNQLFSGITFIVLGILLLLFYNKASQKQRESSFFEKPYLKNAGIGFILFGVYYIFMYVTRNGGTL